MSDLISKIKDIYAAFGRGDIQTILATMTDDISWEFEAPAELSWAGMRHGPQEALGFFNGIAAEHANPHLQMTEFVYRRCRGRIRTLPGNRQSHRYSRGHARCALLQIP